MNYTFGPDVQFHPEELDRMYREAFGYKTDGTFVEVGAYDGKSYSHTWGLAQIGWTGVYVEPVFELCERCLENHRDHPNIHIFRCAAGRESGKPKELYINANCCCGSTLNPTVCNSPEVREASVLTLNDILNAAEIKPAFDLLSIDVEFGEMEVLAGFSLEHWLPKMIIIELCEHHDEPKHTMAKPARDYCEELFPKHGYRKIFSDWINTIFVRDTPK